MTLRMTLLQRLIAVGWYVTTKPLTSGRWEATISPPPMFARVAENWSHNQPGAEYTAAGSTQAEAVGRAFLGWAEKSL